MKKRNPIFDSLGYIPPIKLSKTQLKKRRKEAMFELNNEKNKRRKLREIDIVLWKKYKKETREKIKNLNLIVQGKIYG